MSGSVAQLVEQEFYQGRGFDSHGTHFKFLLFLENIAKGVLELFLNLKINSNFQYIQCHIYTKF